MYHYSILQRNTKLHLRLLLRILYQETTFGIIRHYIILDISPGFNIAIALGVGNVFVMPVILQKVLYLRDIINSLPFIIASVLSCAIVSIGVAYVRYEYSAVASGLVSCLVTALMAHYNIGLSKNYIPNYDRRSKARHNYYRFYKNWLKSTIKVKDELILD